MHPPGQHHCLAAQRMLPQHCLDLARLDAKATDLHLVVEATKELEVPIWQIAR